MGGGRGGVGDGGLILNFDVLFEVSAYSRVRGGGGAANSSIYGIRYFEDKILKYSLFF